MPSINSTAAELYETYAEHLCSGIDGALHDKTTDLAACLRADARRFAAYKAHYVETAVKNLLNDEKIPAEQRQSNAERAMRIFHRWGQTERNYAVQSTQMAEKWQAFERDGDRYLLQYRTAHDEKVRATHAALHGVTLPPDDPFWNEYYPPLGWNCRCTVVQVRRGKYAESDSHAATATGRQATAKTPSFRFNPGKQRKCFPDNVSYLKHAGQNRKEREKVEEKCEKIDKSISITKAKELLLNKSTECTIKEKNYNVEFTNNELAHYCDIAKDKKLYWIKNEILPQIREYIKNAECVGRKISDTTHNTNPRTKKLKENTDYFFYFKIKLPNGENAFLHLGRYRDNQKLYLYAISKNAPTNMEEL